MISKVISNMFLRRGTDPVKLALVLASIYLMYNSWSLSDLNIRHDRVNFEKILMDFYQRTMISLLTLINDRENVDQGPLRDVQTTPNTADFN